MRIINFVMLVGKDAMLARRNTKIRLKYLRIINAICTKFAFLVSKDSFDWLGFRLLHHVLAVGNP